MKKGLAIAVVCGLCFTGQAVNSASASIAIGPYTFDNNAFADRLVSSSGTWAMEPGGSNLESVLIGSNINDYAYPGINDGSSVASAVLAFVDNSVRNGVGADLAAFEFSVDGEIGRAGCQLTLTINNVTKNYIPLGYGTNAAEYVALVDLSDFGMPANSLLSQFEISGTWPPDPEYSAFGALNNAPPVPVPGAVWLLGSGLAGFFGLRRKKH